MGKALKWFRRILGHKKTGDHHQHSSSKPPHKDKCRWSFFKSYREKDSSAMNNSGNNNAKWSSLCGDLQQQEDSVSDVDRGCEVVDSNKHAIAVAAATAAVAEAAVAAAQATEAVVRLISSSGGCAHEPAAHVSSSCGSREEFAAVKIQSAFRGYLARRALRALTGLVKLQALVRGHIERKRTAERLRRMQALLRAQVRARAGRAQISESSQSSSKFSHFHQPGNGSKSSGRTLDNHEKLHPGWNRSEHRINEQSWDQRVHSTRIGLMDDEKNDKILKVDVGKPHFTSKGRNLFQSTHLASNSDPYNCSFTNSRDSHQTAPNPSSGEVQSLSPLKFSNKAEESPFSNAYNGSQFYSASSKEDSCTAKSDGSRSYLSSYSDHPNYMAYTESSRAKLRSLSAPKQRPPYEKSSSTKRYSIYDFGLHANFPSKAYPGSGRLNRLGMPVGYRY